MANEGYVSGQREAREVLRGRTKRERISVGLGDGVPLPSDGKKQSLRMFFILGASWRFPSVFCRGGTG